MLGDPEAAVAEHFGVRGEVARVVERAARVRGDGHAREIENRECRHRSPRDVKGMAIMPAMPWWGWLVLGIGLLGVELFVVDAQFYLVFIGVAAALVGLLGLAGSTMPQWAQWLLFAALSIVTMVAFRKRVYEVVGVVNSAGYIRCAMSGSRLSTTSSSFW